MKIELETCARLSQADEPNNPEPPSTAYVLAEVERRRAEAGHRVGERQRQAVILTDRFVFWLSKHWLAVFNTLAFLYVGLPTLAPMLMVLGATGPAMVIYTIYRLLCNQLPHRSWFLFGPQFAYTLPELAERVGADALTGMWGQDFIGNEVVGYKMALCQRCAAIYGAIFLFGLLYALGRRRVRPLPWWAYIGLGLLPMAVDGGYQFLSYALPLLLPWFPITPRETSPLMRTVTGALFGLATVWLAYPYVQETMDELRQTLHRRFGWQ
jgi:uncharacterized membrane protein